MSEFTEKFTTYSNTDLLKIIDTPERYQPEAVQTAIVILNSRELTPEEYEKVKNELEAEKQAEKSQNEKYQVFNEQPSPIESAPASVLIPPKNSSFSIDNGINLIAICCVLLFAFYIYNSIIYVSYLLSPGGVHDLYVSTILYFIDFIYFPIAAFLLYKRKQLGWIFMVYFCIGSLINTIVFLKMMMNSFGEERDYPILSFQNPAINVFRILLFSLWLWFLCKKDVVKIYKITNKALLFTIIISLTAHILLYQIHRY